MKILFDKLVSGNLPWNMSKNTHEFECEAEAPETPEVNWMTSSMEEITKHQIEWIENILFCMGHEKRLCDKTGSAVIEEFQFKGSKIQVEEQLRALRERLINTPYAESDRNGLIEAQSRFSRHVKQRAEFPAQKAYRECFKKCLFGDESEETLKKLDVKVKKNYDTIHDKGECICFNNT